MHGGAPGPGAPRGNQNALKHGRYACRVGDVVRGTSDMAGWLSHDRGYCRVSTDGQTLDVQIAELKAADATKIFAEKQSGARSDRPQLQKALAALGEGDTLIVTRLDRVARSTRDLLNVLQEVGEAGALFKSLHDTWADTTTPHGRLMLTILGGLAEFERRLTKARTDVGIKRAREAGIRFGRPPKLTRHQQEQALKLVDQGEPQSAVARLFNADPSTISRLASRVAA
jgi:DNA invertase Pin-like site-specific DNA recombinase